MTALLLLLVVLAGLRWVLRQMQPSCSCSECRDIERRISRRMVLR